MVCRCVFLVFVCLCLMCLRVGCVMHRVMPSGVIVCCVCVVIVCDVLNVCVVWR